MIKLFGHPMSTCTRKVLFTLHETNTPFELTVVDFAKGEHKAPAYMERQPFGQLPALDDDGFRLFESRAIARYIDEKAGHVVSPKDLQGRALMEQWISVETSDFYPYSMSFIYRDVFKREMSAADMEKAQTRLDMVAGVLDRHLGASKKPWLVGDQFTIADIAYAPYLEYGMNTGAKEILAKYPNLLSWWGRVSERPAWQKTRG
ncbi:MAG: glutathione binding-like protein [Kofleriaceae bacterium]